MTLFKLGLMAILIPCPVLYAVSPISGWYAGLIVGASKAAAQDTLNLSVGLPSLGYVDNQMGSLSYSILGNLGVQIGFRFNNFRFEGQFLYNNNPYYQLKIDDQVIAQSGSTTNSSSTSVQSTDTGTQTPQNGYSSTMLQRTHIAPPIVVPPIQINSSSAQLTGNATGTQIQLNGYTNTYAFMFNEFYDFYLRDYTSSFVPYVGAGIGFAQRQSTITFLYQGTTVNNIPLNQSSNQLALQGILGVSYFVSDYASFNLDFRYLASSKTNTSASNSSLFETNPKLYSINLLFNSTFNI